MIEWRSMSGEEMHQCWKKLAEKIEEGVFGQIQGGRQQNRSLPRQRLSFGMEVCAKKQEVQNTKVARILLGKNLRLVQGI